LADITDDEELMRQ